MIFTGSGCELFRFSIVLGALVPIKLSLFMLGVVVISELSMCVWAALVVAVRLQTLSRRIHQFFPM